MQKPLIFTHILHCKYVQCSDEIYESWLIIRIGLIWVGASVTTAAAILGRVDRKAFALPNSLKNSRSAWLTCYPLNIDLNKIRSAFMGHRYNSPIHIKIDHHQFIGNLGVKAQIHNKQLLFEPAVDQAAKAVDLQIIYHL